MKHRRPIAPDYIHSGFFGIQDSLVSTTGVLAGIAVTTANVQEIFLTGVIVIAVSAISLGASEFVSDQTEEGSENTKSHANPLISAVIILVTSIIAGLIPLLPYLVFEKYLAIAISVIGALVGLIILGIYKGKLTHKSPTRSALEVFFIGGASAAIGIAVGVLFRI
jgi:predicted membrane protein (TIGR00267 family)